MFRQLNVAATGMDAMEKDLITITNNVSNVKTTGFKKSRVELAALFPDILEEAQKLQTEYKTKEAERNSSIKN